MATVLWSSDDFYTGSARRMPRIMVPISGSGEVPIWHMADGYAYRLWDRGMSGEPGRGSNWITYPGETKAKIFGWQITRPFKYAGQTGPISVMFHTYNSTPSNRHRVYLGIAILKPNGTYVQQQNIHHIDIAETSRTVIASSKSFQPGDRLIVQLGRSVIHAGQSAHLNYGKNLTRVEFPADVIFDTDPYDVTPVPPVEPDPEEVPQENEDVVPDPVDDGWSGPAPQPPPPVTQDGVGDIINASTLKWDEVYTPLLGYAGRQSFGAAYGNGVYVLVSGTDNVRGVSVSYDAVNWESAQIDLDLTPIIDFSTAHGQFILASGAKVFTSQDGYIWTPRSAIPYNPTQLSLRANSQICSGNGYVVVSQGQACWVSQNMGQSWVAKTLVAKLSDLYFHRGKFVYSDSSQRVYVSSDMNTWTQAGVIQKISSESNLKLVANTGDKLIAAGGIFKGDGRPRYSTNFGANWVIGTDPPQAEDPDGAFGNTIIENVDFHSSTDLQSWKTTSAAVGASPAWIMGAGGRKLFYTFGAGRVKVASEWGLSEPIYTSYPKQRYWYRQRLPITQLSSIAYGSGRFVVAGAGWGTVSITENGVSWWSVEHGDPKPYIKLGYGNGRFIMVKSDASVGSALESTDGGQTWREIVSAQYSLRGQTSNVGYLGDDEFLVLFKDKGTALRITKDGRVLPEYNYSHASNGNYYNAALCIAKDLIVAPSGAVRTFIRHVKTGALHSFGAQAIESYGISSVAYGAGKFLAVRTGSTKPLQELDLKNPLGYAWIEKLAPEASTTNMQYQAVEFNSGNFVIAGVSEKKYHVSADGESWSSWDMDIDANTSPIKQVASASGGDMMAIVYQNGDVLVGSVNPDFKSISSGFIPTITIS
jgi:hypothetical protein